jgi:hypothetical protein
VTFRYKEAQSNGAHPLHYSLVGKEVAQVCPDLVQYDPKTGEPNAVLYQFLPAMLLDEIQEQHRRIAARSEQIQSLQEQLEGLTAQTCELLAILHDVETRDAG